jgi:hypothetical protein
LKNSIQILKIKDQKEELELKSNKIEHLTMENQKKENLKVSSNSLEQEISIANMEIEKIKLINISRWKFIIFFVQ